MLRSIQVAKNGLGNTAPNPMVGSVIVYNGTIIGEGFTSPYGGPHAEVNAIAAVKDKSLLALATLYVTLEPCAHYGNTPPCANMIVTHGIPNVVIGTLDPNEKVAGKGVAILKEGGCQVTTGVLEKECQIHHKRFLTFQNKKRPYVILKWAQTQDGFIAPEPILRSEKPTPFWITNAHSKQLVHKWRTEEQSILVGTTTALADNPKLDARTWKGKNPIRILIDKELKVSASYHLLDDNIKTLIFTATKDTTDSKNVTYITLDFTQSIIPQLLHCLHKNNITSVIIEGGSATLSAFIKASLWDEARVFTSLTNFGSGLTAPHISASPSESIAIATDTLTYYYND